MRDLSKYFVDTLGIEESLENVDQSVADEFVNEVIIGKLPEGHKWQFLYYSEGENEKQVDDLAILLLANDYGTNAFFGGMVGISCTYDNRKSWATWFSWGISTPMSSAPSEIFVAVKES